MKDDGHTVERHIFTTQVARQFGNTENDNVTDEDEDLEPAFCCLKGCLTGSTVAALLLIVLPAGILVTVYSKGNDDTELLCLGIALICISIICVPVTIAAVMRKKCTCKRESKV